ncbi:MAG: 4-hydroxy-2-oxovalerate aldolase [Candidatus Dormiibacterota bacterium]
MTPEAGAQAVRVTDSTLRDGSHAMSHRFSVAQVVDIVEALDQSGVQVIEVSHGDGIGGSSFNFGFSEVEEITLIRSAVEAARSARIACLLIPGIGTVDDLRQAHDAGASVVRIATHCTEADISEEHFGVAQALGLETVGFLMLSHRLDPDGLAKQARIMADAGAQCVYIVDSAGALTLEEVRDRVAALVAELGQTVQVGFHGHQNLGLGVANSIVAHEAGALQVDGCLIGLGAGAGNSPTEVLVAVLDRIGVPTGIDLDAILAAAEEVVRPMVSRVPFMDRGAIVQGYFGVYSSFLLHAERASTRYGVPLHKILERVGQKGYVGGQEDMIIDVAVSLSRPVPARN